MSVKKTAKKYLTCMQRPFRNSWPNITIHLCRMRVGEKIAIIGLKETRILKLERIVRNDSELSVGGLEVDVFCSDEDLINMEVK